MALRLPKSADIPFLTSYTPFASPEQEAVSIDDMVRVTIPPDLLTSDLNYVIGLGEDSEYLVSIVNVTANANLSILITCSNKALTNPDAVIVDGQLKLTTQIRPRETFNTTFSLNKENLDASDNYDVYPINFSLTVRNIFNGSIVLKAG
jgi:hypothetical protein